VLPRLARKSVPEINYLAYVLINVYQNKYGQVYVDSFLSSGASENPLQRVAAHTLPINTPQPIAEALAITVLPRLLVTPVNPLANQYGEVLKGIIGIYRHGDRTPKQKMKVCMLAEEASVLPQFSCTYSGKGEGEGREGKEENGGLLTVARSILMLVAFPFRAGRWW